MFDFPIFFKYLINNNAYFKACVSHFPCQIITVHRSLSKYGLNVFPNLSWSLPADVLQNRLHSSKCCKCHKFLFCIHDFPDLSKITKNVMPTDAQNLLGHDGWEGLLLFSFQLCGAKEKAFGFLFPKCFFLT